MARTACLQRKVDTGIDRFTLRQILPGEESTAFVGTRPPVEGKVSEPLLAIVDHAAGRMCVESLSRLAPGAVELGTK